MNFPLSSGSYHILVMYSLLKFYSDIYKYIGFCLLKTVIIKYYINITLWKNICFSKFWRFGVTEGGPGKLLPAIFLHSYFTTLISAEMTFLAIFDIAIFWDIATYLKNIAKLFQMENKISLYEIFLLRQMHG